MLILLALNVVGVGLFLFQHDATPWLWVNLIGCVVFGIALEDWA